MQIVEIGDCSMVIMKDSRDSPWFSTGSIYRRAQKYNQNIVVEKYADDGQGSQKRILQKASDYIYTAGRLILFFKESISQFHLHDTIQIYVGDY